MAPPVAKAGPTTILGDRRATLGLVAATGRARPRPVCSGQPGHVIVVLSSTERRCPFPEVAGKADALLEGLVSRARRWQHRGRRHRFGDAKPGGKLPVTIARSEGQLPIFYNQKPRRASRLSVRLGTEPLFPFGFGLSYTSFEIGSPQLSATRVSADQPVTVSVEVRNTGKLAGDEVVQLYLHETVEETPVTRPVKELQRAFVA